MSPSASSRRGWSSARGKLFVLNGNLVNFAPAGPSWLTVVDPVTNTVAEGIDSIPLTGEGNAGFGAVGGDGLIYVMSTGQLRRVATAASRSWTRWPARSSPAFPASAAARATSPPTAAGPDLRELVRRGRDGVRHRQQQGACAGAGQGVPVPSNSAVAVDSKGRMYAIETGPCSGGQPGTAHVLDEAFDRDPDHPLGECPVGAAVVQIPPE